MTAPSKRTRMRRADSRAERGIVMWVALVVLIVMSLAGLAMLRQMGGASSIAGNIAFKENATSTADAGIEAARLWLIEQARVNIGALDNDMLAQGYMATWGATIDPAQIFRTPGLTPIAVPLDAAVGNNTTYVIQRLCASPGPVQATTQVCSDLEDDTMTSRGGLTYNLGRPPPRQIKAFFRLTAQVQGPRNTLSYTQIILN